MLAFAVGALVVMPPPVAAGPIETAVSDLSLFNGQNAGLGLARGRAGGASYVRLQLHWAAVAPEAATKPAGFNASDPRDARYSWSALDKQVKLAVANGLEPIVTVTAKAPDWAEAPDGNKVSGVFKPSPTEYAAFATAAAIRYSGAFSVLGVKLPRVRFWQAWNEPNKGMFLKPQWVNGKPYSPIWYRAMLNKFTAAVRAIPVVPSTAKNTVVTGGLAPVARTEQMAPKEFMRAMLCVSKAPYKATCSYKSSFDIWSHHPYTCGGPSRHALSSEDVVIGDLPEMRDLLLAAVRVGHVGTTQTVRFWVTEFSWDTQPPDPKGVPTALHARWVAEALYKMWRSGVSMVTWFMMRDETFPGHYQSGFYPNTGRTFVKEQPKLSLTAFRFPFVAYVVDGRVSVWGRTPPSGALRPVVIERYTSTGWKTIGTLTAGAAGLFAGKFATTTTGYVRARMTLPSGATLASVRFSLARPVDPYICPFGK